MRKVSLVAAATFIAGLSIASAEPNRTLLVNENRAPELGQLEVGGFFFDREYDAADETEFGAYARYGIWENLTAKVYVPHLDIEPDFGDSESGIGDVVVGLNLLAWEDIFEYPYVIPHIDVSLGTGDEDKGLGTGETDVNFGVSVGTVTYEELHWIADLSYVMSGGSDKDDPDDVVVASLGLIWDISDRFSIHGEGTITDEDTDSVENPIDVIAGMTYDWTDSFEMSLYGGGGDTFDSLVGVKAAYTF